MRIRRSMCAMTFALGVLAFAAEAAAGNLIYEGGPVIPVAKAVDIFWGPSFSNPASPDYQYAQALIAYRNQLGTNREYNVITQYYQIVGGTRQYIRLSNLAAGTPDWFDSSTPPVNVTDAVAQGEVQRYLATHAADASTVYEVFLPATSYSSFDGETSCGGPSVGFCAYHNSVSPLGSTVVKYAVQPYPSCSACQVSGWNAIENQEHFVAYTTRATVVNPQFNSWYNAQGLDGDSICLWSPPPFLDNGGAYPYEWSNLASGCVKWR